METGDECPVGGLRIVVGLGDGQGSMGGRLSGIHYEFIVVHRMTAVFCRSVFKAITDRPERVWWLGQKTMGSG